MAMFVFILFLFCILAVFGFALFLFCNLAVFGFRYILIFFNYTEMQCFVLSVTFL
jgi:hypothetical protein